MGSVQIDKDPTFTDADRNAFKTLYGADDSASIKGPKINRQDFYGKTPLYSACEYGRTEVAQFLLKEFNADIDIAADNGLTPLQIADHNRHKNVLRLLNDWQTHLVTIQPSKFVSHQESVRESPKLISGIDKLSMDDLLKAGTPRK